MIIYENDDVIIRDKSLKRFTFDHYHADIDIHVLKTIDSEMEKLTKKYNGILQFKSPLIVSNNERFFRTWHNYVYEIFYDHGLNILDHDVICSISAYTLFVKYENDDMYTALIKNRIIQLNGISDLNYLDVVHSYIPNNTIHSNNLFIFRNKILLHTQVGIYEISAVHRWEKYFLNTNLYDYIDKLENFHIHHLSHISL